MANQTILLFDEIIEQIGTNLEALQIHLNDEGADAPSQSDRAAIERVEAILRRAKSQIETEKR